jgi:hypothetical protein
VRVSPCQVTLVSHRGRLRFGGVGGGGGGGRGDVGGVRGGGVSPERVEQGDQGEGGGGGGWKPHIARVEVVVSLLCMCVSELRVALESGSQPKEAFFRQFEALPVDSTRFCGSASATWMRRADTVAQQSLRWNGRGRTSGPEVRLCVCTTHPPTPPLSSPMQTPVAAPVAAATERSLDCYVVRPAGVLAEILGAVELGEDELLIRLRELGLITYPSPLLVPLLEEWPDVLAVEVLAQLDPTDLVLFGQAGRACRAAVVAFGVPQEEDVEAWIDDEGTEY